MNYIYQVFVFSIFFNNAVLSREPKAIGIFNIIKFPNDPCDTGSGNTRNGTCYLAEECENRKGVATGTCADGYGVCCVLAVACGGTTTENCTYLDASKTIASDSTCQYQICPSSSAISRIRLDLTTFTIAGPVTAALNGGHLLGGALGDCITDTFTVTGSARGSPVICGSNSGQHLFVDVDGSCVNVNFVFGADTFTRSYDIKVLQFDKRNEMGGPQGCLQFYSGTSGVFKTFNYVDTSISSSHLSSQDYDICFRRGADMCVICYSPTTPATPSSFGLSISTDDAVVKAAQQSNCVTDFLMVPEGNTLAIANSATVISSTDLFCGRFFSITTDSIASATVCSRKTPFRVSFYTNANEVDGAAADEAATDKAKVNELSKDPRGNLGFSLDFFQSAC